MDEHLAKMLKEVREHLQPHAHPHCTSVDVTFTSQSYEITYYTRSPGGLRRDGVSM